MLTHTNIPRSGQGLCPRCEFLVANNIDPDRVEIRDMSTLGRSRIVVPRVEFHPSGATPKNAIPI